MVMLVYQRVGWFVVLVLSHFVTFCNIRGENFWIIADMVKGQFGYGLILWSANIYP